MSVGRPSEEMQAHRSSSFSPSSLLLPLLPLSPLFSYIVFLPAQKLLDLILSRERSLRVLGVDRERARYAFLLLPSA